MPAATRPARTTEALALALHGALPTGFELHREGAGVLACARGGRPALEAAGLTVPGRHFGPGADRMPDAAESGREPLGMIVVDGTECLVRRFTHGGLARRITGRRFRDGRRPFLELALSERLRAAGIETPRVVAARAVQVRPRGFELTLVTERRHRVTDVGVVLGEVRRGRRGRLALRRAVEASARAIALLHGVGFVHADLQPANVLVTEASLGARSPSSTATVIDLDRSAFDEAPLGRSLRVGNLGRLWRHVRRREQQYGTTLSSRDLLRFLRAYGCPRGDWERMANDIDAAASERSGLHRDRVVARAAVRSRARSPRHAALTYAWVGSASTTRG